MDLSLHKKMKLSIKDLSSKEFGHKKSLMQIFIFCAVLLTRGCIHLDLVSCYYLETILIRFRYIFKIRNYFFDFFAYAVWSIFSHIFINYLQSLMTSFQVLTAIQI